RNEDIGCLEPSAAQFRRQDHLHRFQFLRRVDAEVNLSRANIRMTEPQRDFADVTGRLKHHDGTAVPELMRRYRTPFQRRTCLTSGSGMFMKHVLESCSRHGASGTIYKQFRYGDVAAHREPRAEISGSLFPKRKAPFSSTLAHDSDAGRCL